MKPTIFPSLVPQDLVTSLDLWYRRQDPNYKQDYIYGDGVKIKFYFDDFNVMQVKGYVVKGKSFGTSQL